MHVVTLRHIPVVEHVERDVRAVRESWIVDEPPDLGQVVTVGRLELVSGGRLISVGLGPLASIETRPLDDLELMELAELGLRTRDRVGW